ncbi:MAG: hypothetical protein Q7S45_04415 [Candidatus Curtissbacteria bacterium]|nr:hypothetical protein [Candidatus Curtissbacteria bacterium]
MIKTITDDVTKGKKEIGKSNKNRVFKHVRAILIFPKKRIQRFLIRAGIVFTAIIAAIIILEIGLRVFEKKIYDLSPCQSLDENFHHVMVQNSICRSKTDEWDIIYKINGVGLRGDDISSKKPADTFRVLVLGDSFVQGYGVEFENSFPKILEKELNSQDFSKKVEVTGAGVLGYSPLLEYLYLKEKGLAFNPDLVILAFNQTDFWDDRQRFSELKLSYPNLNARKIEELVSKGEAKFDFSKINKSPGNWPQQKIYLPGISYQIKTWLSSNLRTYKTIVDFVKKRSMPVQQDSVNEGDIDRDILAIERGSKLSDESYSKLWELPVKHIAMMKSLLDQSKIPFVVMAIPDAMQVSDQEWPGRKALGFDNHLADTRPPFEDELARRLEDINTPVINLLPGFKASNIFPLYFKYDGHWRESGHKLAGEIIVTYLGENTFFRDLFKSKQY